MIISKGLAPSPSRHRLGLLFLYSTTSGFHDCTPYAKALNIAIITGSTRVDGPPRPVLGPRVTECLASDLRNRGHQIHILDPKELQLDFLNKPEFAYSRSLVPPNLAEIREQLEAADAFVAVTPEYNHAPSPALLNILNHFGSSVFSFKPSAIVTYSAGQWGGTRAAIGLRPVLSELGCLPVSAMIHIPKAGAALNEAGEWVDDAEKWHDYTGRCWSQLEWWGTAARQHKEQVDPFVESPALSKNPSQRNAPN